MSQTSKGILGAALALGILVLLQTWLVGRARKQAGQTRTVSFWDLIVTSEDERYSLSRLQLYIWFLVIYASWGAVCFATGQLHELSEGLNLLLGINAGAAVSATAITAMKGAPTSQTNSQPNFVQDIFFEKPGSLDLPRTQMFAWTLVIALGFIAVLIETFHAGSPKLPEVPLSLAVLMGISHGAYLGVKAAAK